MAWKNFTSVVSSSGWANPANANDGNSGTYAEYNKTGTWTSFLELGVEGHELTSVRYYVTYGWGGSYGYDWDLKINGSMENWKGGRTYGGWQTYDPISGYPHSETIDGTRLRVADAKTGYVRIHLIQFKGALIEDEAQGVTYFLLA